MDKDSIQDFLEEFRPLIGEDGGDYVILEVREDYVKLKIKGARNRDRSRDNLRAVIDLALKKQFPEGRILVEMVPWKPEGKPTAMEKLKDFFGFGS